MSEQKSVVKQFFRLTMISFSIAILVMSLFGWMFGSTALETSAAFELGSYGLPHRTIFNVLLLAVVNSGISVFVANYKVFTRIMLLWQLMVNMFSCLLVSSVMVAAFRWIERDALSAWLWFVLTFIGSFIFVAIIIVLKIRREDKKYNDLLSNYKKEHGKND